MPLQPTDQLLIGRGNESFKISYQELVDQLKIDVATLPTSEEDNTSDE